MEYRSVPLPSLSFVLIIQMSRVTLPIIKQLQVIALHVVVITNPFHFFLYSFFCPIPRMD